MDVSVENFLDIENVAAGYAGTNIVSDISLKVMRGETFGLIGLNGAGKTTLIKTILGLKEAQAGRIFVAGEDAGSESAKKNLAYLPERFDPPWFLNAYEFIDFTMALYNSKVTRADVEAISKQVGFDKQYLSQKAGNYSKGMRQKVGLMATFLTPAPLLILDEPMSGLDPLARFQVKSLLEKARSEGRTCFLSSHILADMEEMCDRVAVLHSGTLRFTGAPSKLLVDTGEKYLERAFLKHIGGG